MTKSLVPNDSSRPLGRGEMVVRFVGLQPRTRHRFHSGLKPVGADHSIVPDGTRGYGGFIVTEP
ncbi:MAG: hypothetical protein N3A72_08540 [bacterium]|nr:hypothetical protein [bacterium]